ncbi:disintegrin and metalloproteinase domain-containing protein 11-like isoform X1 [Denticeps clupeoides]|uniref:disintegrin and metalloproteinase domain-containing protein 11-like isoform X1 n=1 Tax=Denticeps clupeoides TaxID=299321 RepID=UPI0010A3D2D7|nr:disintegrin and metalloproteinase domain-containing protein 11-like isoform X1 [Denticeps clupeoides]
MLALPCLLLAASVAGRSGDGDTARPARLLLQRDGDGDAELRDPRLDTRVHSRNQADPQQPVHLAQTSFLVKAFKTSFILDLELNHDLLSSDYVERHVDEDGTMVQSPVSVLHLDQCRKAHISHVQIQDTLVNLFT